MYILNFKSLIQMHMSITSKTLVVVLTGMNSNWFVSDI